MATTATLAQGTAFEIDLAAGVAWSEVAELTDIQGPTMSREVVDVTHHQSANQSSDFINGKRDNGEITLTMNYLPVAGTQDATTGLIQAYETGNTLTWRITWTDTGLTQWDGVGLVTSFQPSSPVDGVLSATCVIKVTGDPTLA